MDRQHNAQTAELTRDDQFQKALRVITLSYEGSAPEQVSRDAIACFDTLIEISHSTDAFRDFARRNAIDIKYLVDGANFVISRMHFNSEGNYYMTLGLSRTSSPEEIHQRWKRLMLLYHPDRQPGNEEWVNERAKKVNEAYNVLKDDLKRADFDRKLSAKVETAYKQGVYDLAGQPWKPKRSADDLKHSGRARKLNSDPSVDRFRRQIPKIVIAVSILASILFLGFIYIQNNTATIESQLTSTGQQGPPEKPRPDLQPSPLDSQTPREPVQTQDQKMPDAPSSVASVQQNQQDTAIASKSDADSRKTDRLPFSLPSLFLKTRSEGQKQQASPSLQRSSEKAAEKQGNEKAETPLSTQQRTVSVRETVAETHAVPREQVAFQEGTSLSKTRISEPGQQDTPKPETSDISKDEAEAFIRAYAQAYSKGDLRVFFSLFTRTAVENNVPISQLKGVYQEIFTGKINFYKVQNLDIRTAGQTATVSANYQINRFNQSDAAWTSYTGSISWKIVRESGSLKIASMTHDK